MSQKSMINAQNIVYEYIRRDEEGNVESINRAVDGVSVDVKAGEFIAILGHNGSGKSTFAKNLNRLLTPTQGTLWVNGYDASDNDNIWNIRQSAGMVFQNPDNQIISSVVEEDVGFGPENLGVQTDEIWKRVGDALNAVDMMKYRKYSPNKLSGGQKQRVAIAGVLAMQPDCIILDEATAMLDPQGRQEVLETVHALNKLKNVTIILITHYMEEVTGADRVFVMNHGKVQLSGTPREIFSDVETIKECQLDLPQIAKLAYELRQEGLDIPEGILTMEELVDSICQLY
mgnify:CR=1 FL=1